MRSATIIIALFVQGLAKEQVNQAQKPANGMMIDKVVDKLVDKLLGGVVRMPTTGLAGRSVATRANSPFLKSAQSKYSGVASLPGPTALKQLVVDQFEQFNRRGSCAVRAEEGETALATGGETYSKFMADPSKTAPMSEAAFKDMAGITAPLGVFDPLGIATKVPEGQLLFYREAELKHGRVCMLAILGLVVGERHDFFPILKTGIDEDLPAYAFGAGQFFPFLRPDLVEQGLSSPEVPLSQFWPILVGALFFEEFRREAFRKDNPSLAPGDYGWDPLGLKPKDAKGLKELQTKELNNGRLAMFAAAGIIAQEMLTGKKILLELGLFGR